MKLFVELADTPEMREQGLMDRKSLPFDKGMLFRFQSPHRLAFWMKNTYIPLDLAYLSDEGKILQVSELIPLSTKPVYANTPCRYALEVNKGWLQKNNLSVGSVVDLRFLENQFSDSLKTTAQVAMEPVEEEVEENLDAPLIDEEIDAIPEDAIENEFGQFDPMQEEVQDISPNVQLLRSYRDILEYAEQNNLTLMISYYSLSGRYWGPRRIAPLENEGYPIKRGPNGEFFTAFDMSPTISGNGWSIEGGSPKSFILGNVIDLEIVEEN